SLAGQIFGPADGGVVAQAPPGGIDVYTFPTQLPGRFIFTNVSDDRGYASFPITVTSSAADGVFTVNTDWPTGDDLLNPVLFERRTRTWALQAQWWAAYASEVWQWNGV